MKKIISLLGIVSITASTASVASCSMVNNKKQSIFNKVNNLTKISSTLLRGAMIQNASQSRDNGLPYDANFLLDLINSSSAKELMPDFNTNYQTNMSSLNSSYFNQNLTRDEINKIAKVKDSTNENSLFLTNNVKSPNGPADSIGSLLTVFIGIIKANGGIHPNSSGLIQSFLPELKLSENNVDQFSSEKMKPIAKILDQWADVIALIIKLAESSNLPYFLIANFLNVNFWTTIKENNWNINSLGTIDLVINKILNVDKIENLTNKKIMNAAVKRLNNIFANLSRQNDKVIEDINELYKDIDYDFENKFGDTFAGFLKNINNLDTSNMIPILFDALFVVSAILHRITSIDFSQDTPQSHDDLYSYKGEVGRKEKKNLKFLKELGEQEFNNKYSSKILIKNLSIALNAKENDGLNFAKLIGLLFQSGSKKTFDIAKPGILGWVPALLGKLTTLSGDYTGAEGFSPLLYAIGNGLAQWKNIKINVVAEIGPNQIGNFMKAIIDTFIENRSINGLDSLFDFLKTFGVKIPFRFNQDEIMKNSWRTLWSSESTFLKTIIGGETNTSLQTILNSHIFLGKNISEILNLLYESINSSNPNLKKVENINKASTLMANGFRNLSTALIDDKYSIFYGNDIPYKQGNNKYTSLQTLMITSDKNGLYIEFDNIKNKKVKGVKSAMFALGSDFDDLGKQKNNFREETILSGLEKIFDDPSINALFDQILEGFKEVNRIKKELTNFTYKQLIGNMNFKTKVLSYEGIDQPDTDAFIKYKTTYTDILSWATFFYEIELKLTKGSNEWKITSIERK
ncbi:hypothetical protein [Spiroplasma cantharicola]|uniref:MOLPALP family lipoprotein n=1 Tax=Spiroplasma cantharicola TaxID=362837 RepID=A0A0M4KC65_9MOLU|nr:hypothetical protein [Spiroplasma cantharicola]ALD66240.1 hypothetical protein SCANT_v1c03300 [Spiroplasma cantharicola]